MLINLVLCTAISLFFAVTAAAATQVNTNHECAADIGPIGNCTANDIKIADATNAEAAVSYCVPDPEQPIEITRINVEYELNAAQRYDPLLWVGLAGNDPRDEGGRCFVSSVTENLPPPTGTMFSFIEGDNDSCLDVNNTGTAEVPYEPITEVLCSDSDGNGWADIHAIVSWQQNTGQNCGTETGEAFGLGAPSKCNYSLIPLVTMYDPAMLTIITTVINDGGGTAVASDWSIVITDVDDPVEGVNPSMNNFPGAESPGTNVFFKTGTYDNAGKYNVNAGDGPVDYMLTRSPGCESSLSPGESAVCTITSTFIPPPSPPTLTLVKTVIGGTLTQSDFPSFVDGSPQAWDVATEVTEDVEHTVSETPHPDYMAGDWGGDCAADGTITLALGETGTCTITNTFNEAAPTLTLVKTVIGGTLTQDDFPSFVDGSPQAWDVATEVTEDVEHTVSETPHPDYMAGDWGGDCAADGTITLALGETGTCTITNTFNEAAPTLTLVKTVIGGTLTQSDFPSFVDGSPQAWDVATEVTEDVEHTVSETPHPDYMAGDWGGDCAADGTITLALGETGTCHIENTSVPPPTTATLTLVKIVSGGEAAATDWILTADGAGDNDLSGAGGASGELLPDSFDLSESGESDDYTASDWVCTGDGVQTGAQITLEAGHIASCTITNVKIPPLKASLTVIKQVINNYGGTAVASQWTMNVDATNPTLSSFPGEESPGTTITIDPGYYSVDESNDGPDGYEKTLSDSCNGELAEGQSAVCIITNYDKKDIFPPNEISVNKTISTLPFGCPVVIGTQAGFSISVENIGSTTAQDVILYDHWSEHLKPAKTPDMYDCSQPKPRTLRCKLGNLEAGGVPNVYEFSFFVIGPETDEACNYAWTPPLQAEPDYTAENESKACFELVNQLGLQPDQLSKAQVGVIYNQVISITGGWSELSNQVEVDGLPAGGLYYKFDDENNEILIFGCPDDDYDEIPFDLRVAYSADDPDQACDFVAQNFNVTYESLPDCVFDPQFIEQRGIPTKEPTVLPDESVQKVAVDFQNNSYVIGFTYLDHNYTVDPNGQYTDHKKNYDIRLSKFDEFGEMLWDKTYDTGNNDYGYAVTLSPDKSKIYIGGGAQVESAGDAWHDAVLLELDATSGCPVGQHFQSSGRGTTSAYYDIEVNWEDIYAVGEVQINPIKPEEPMTPGGLVNVLSRKETASRDNCADDVIIPDATAANLILTDPNNLIRKGDTPTVAYSVALPPANCETCEVLIGGASGANGWVDSLNASNTALIPFKSQTLMSIQDIAVQGDRIVLVGASPDNDMLMLGYNREGASLWNPNPINIGPGRLRGVVISDNGFIYTAGTSNINGAKGHLFKFNVIGEEIEEVELVDAQADFSFSDLALFRSTDGTTDGIVSGQIETEPNTYGGLRFNFECRGNCNPQPGR